MDVHLNQKRLILFINTWICFRLTCSKMDIHLTQSSFTLHMVVAALVWTLYISSRATVSAQGQTVLFFSLSPLFFRFYETHLVVVTICFFITFSYLCDFKQYSLMCLSLSKMIVKFEVHTANIKPCVIDGKRFTNVLLKWPPLCFHTSNSILWVEVRFWYL